MKEINQFKYDFIAFLRSKGMTVTSLAKEMGITAQSIDAFLTRQKFPVERASYLSEKYGCSLEWLVTGKKPETDNCMNIQVVGDNSSNNNQQQNSVAASVEIKSLQKALTDISKNIEGLNATIKEKDAIIAERDKTISSLYERLLQTLQMTK